MIRDRHVCRMLGLIAAEGGRSHTASHRQFRTGQKLGHLPTSLFSVTRSVVERGTNLPLGLTLGRVHWNGLAKHIPSNERPPDLLDLHSPRVQVVIKVCKGTGQPLPPHPLTNSICTLMDSAHFSSSSDSPSTFKQLKVAVIGGGIGGLSAAIALRRAGHIGSLLHLATVGGGSDKLS